MTATEFLQSIRIDGTPLCGVVQITIDAEKTTAIYNVEKSGGEMAQRVITVETEAISIG